ncbi:MAG: hypothetical protein Kow00122_17500 [Thermoleophilia bacterium]
MVTRLTERLVRRLVVDLPAVEETLVRASGLDIVSLACRAAGARPGGPPAAGRRICVVPVTAGRGVIGGFTEAVAAVCRHIGCDATVAPHTDIAGLAYAAERGAEVVLAADDDRFVALNLRSGVCVDNGIATGEAYATALDAAAGGVEGRPVLVIGLGPVGMAGAVRLSQLGAQVLVTDLDAARVEVALHSLPVLVVASAQRALATCDLVLDASPAQDLISAGWVSPNSVVAAPGIPVGVTPEAAAALGDRLVHEPLALGVATMVVKACMGPHRSDRRATGPGVPWEAGRPSRPGARAGRRGGPL